MSKNQQINKNKSIESLGEMPAQKVILYEFFCELYIPNWKQSNITFFWSADPTFGKQAIEFQLYQKVV